MEQRALPVAERLLSLRPVSWSEEEVRTGTAGLGWEWVATERGVSLSTGHPAGDARLTRVESHNVDHTDGEEVLGLHQPLETVEGGTREHVEAFRRAFGELREGYGHPGVMGAYDTLASHFSGSPSWGAPFARWRDGELSLELRAALTGPVLTLLPSGPLESWYRRSYENCDGRMSGFLAIALEPLPFGDLSGMTMPGVNRHEDWKEYARLLSASLGTMAAEMTALGLERSFGLHGRLPGAGGPWVFGFDIGETMRLALYAAAGEGEVDLEDLEPEERGWIRATAPEDLEYEIAFHTEPTPYDEVNGTRLAMMVMEMAEDLGIPFPSDLSLTDWADRVQGGDGRPEYHLYHHGLGVIGNP
ncbi:hypothetical protein [Nocardiopsis lambiniae]|uniref:Uncharacterized protein n=1 Tax=Nocardiopsis lambiniae TaxID=3075539 RepID=A0ABU2MAS7_9ACTN|nr:hypothetical protein [Nocardiopsis sp. DSM 44743]MDT0329778.1 hypothetical protein [Nocardiopsis sp. DSM 44743]